MADIKLPDGFNAITDEECFTAMNVAFQYFTKSADAINYLNFFMKPTIPLRVYSQGSQEVWMPYPVSAVGPATRRVIVGVGIDQIFSSDGSPELTVTSSGVGTSVDVALGEGNTVTGSFPLSPEEQDAPLRYIFTPLTLSATNGQVDLIEALLSGVGPGTAIRAFGVWELPEGTIDTSAIGGILRGRARISSTVTDSVDPSQFFPGKSITSTETDKIFDNTIVYGNPGRIFWAGGLRPITGGFTTRNEHIWSGAGDIPYLGVRFPPYQAKEGQTYVPIKAIVYSEASAGNINLYSESLTYSGGTTTLSTANRYYPGGYTNSTWSTSITPLSGRADPNGDWIYINADDTPTKITQCIMWIDDSIT